MKKNIVVEGILRCRLYRSLVWTVRNEEKFSFEPTCFSQGQIVRRDSSETLISELQKRNFSFLFSTVVINLICAYSKWCFKHFDERNSFNRLKRNASRGHPSHHTALLDKMSTFSQNVRITLHPQKEKTEKENSKRLKRWNQVFRSSYV